MNSSSLFCLLIVFTLILSIGCSTEKRFHNISFSKNKHHSIPDENIAFLKKQEIRNEFEDVQEPKPVISVKEEKLSGKASIINRKEIKKAFQNFKQYYKKEKRNINDEIPADESNEKYNSWAVIALITGLLGVLFSLAGLIIGFLALTGPLSAIAAVIFGPAALKQIKRTGEKGYGMALTGLILGWVVIIAWLLLIILVIIAIALLSGAA